MDSSILGFGLIQLCTQSNFCDNGKQIVSDQTAHEQSDLKPFCLLYALSLSCLYASFPGLNRLRLRMLIFCHLQIGFCHEHRPFIILVTLSVFFVIKG